MSGFGSTGFGGFGSTNNQQSTGFGGFGATNNTTASTGFGSGNTTNNAFGSTGTTNTGGGLFGGGGGTTSAFGGTSSGFGANTGSTFGAAKPAFGATPSTGGGLFGASNTTNTTAAPSTGFGGFGANTTTTNTSSPFGGTSGGGLFGSANKPAFGSGTANTTGGTSLFGGATSTGFGGTTNTASGGFGATMNPGIGSNVGDPPGTAITPFQAHQEKETTGAGNQSNSFQNILFQEPYKKWSSDELRLADYAQGRRHGNASGGGAFGVSNFGSGGFGSTNNQQTTGFGTGASTGGGLFGGGANNTTNTTTTTGAFGGGSTGGFGAGGGGGGGGLFGNNAAKPATGGGLFGSGTATTAAPAQSGGLFGGGSTGGFGATGTTGGFGATNNNTGGGLFGSNNNTATQNKPSGFSFGNTGATTGGFGNTASTGFGANNNTAGNASTTGGLFGSNTGQATGGGLFGNNQAQPQQQNTGSAFGGGFGQQNQQTGGGGLFGNTQQKPATGGGLFGGGGGAMTGGGLFGGGNTSSTSFGATNTNTNTGGGLFGAKPAATGGGLFGSNPAGQTNNAGGGLFGGGLGQNNQTQQQTGQTSLFGGAQNQAKPGGLFGSSQPASSGMFGGQNNQQQGGMFGGVNQQQQQPQNSLFGGSLLGNSQGVSQGPQSLTANINDVSAYGSPSLFSNLGGSETPNPGPLATPLSSKSKPRRSSILPMYKLNPASAARFVTPQKRGFGFSYSTYGTPGGSPSSAASTPGGASRSLLGSSSFNRSLSKSVSTSNLRRSFNAEDSILAPGAFSASSGPRYYGQNGSVKKLIINKDMRSDLFSTPTKEKPSTDLVNGSRKLSKRVSFDTSTMDTPEVDDNDSVLGSTPRVGNVAQESTPASVNVNGSKPASATAEADPSKGKELAIVHEEDTSSQAPEVNKEGLDAAPGAYWMSPTKEALANMNRMQRQQVTNFTVGRDNVGSVRFKVPVDLTNIDLDEIFGGIVILETRSATVYPIAAKKPPVGKGLNVPALISLEQSWPRGRDKRPSNDAKRFNKHIERLKRIEDTTFESYNTDTGVWKFSVEHFTTYGLEYDEDDDEPEQSAVQQPQEEVSFSNASQEDSYDSQSSPREDDTFDFRRNKRRALPGAFDHRDEDFGDIQDAQRPSQRQSFLGDSFAGSTSNALILSTEEETDDQDNGYGTSEDEDMVGTPARRHLAAEQPIDSPEGDGTAPTSETPGGILRARMRALKGSATPMKLQVAGGDEWMDMLQRSVSPQKRDRAFLRSVNETALRPAADDADAASQRGRVVSDGRGFATSIDLMNSLFEKAKAPPAPAQTKGFVQWPYERQTKSFVDQSDMSDADHAFHSSMRPTWGPDGTLLFTSTRSSLEDASKQGAASNLMITKNVIQAEGREIQAAKFSNEDSAKALENHIRLTNVELVGDVPKLSLQPGSLKSLFHDQDSGNPANANEKLVWDLACILFDGDASTESRRSTLSQFWATLVDSASSRSVALAKSSEEKAIAALSGHRVQDACKHLLDGKNFHLATLVSLIGSNDQSKKDMREQLGEWQDANFLSEFSDPVRAIYEILSGNVCVCEGKKEVPLHDRIESFVISERFGLDWKQAFGLRLWYSISRKDDLSAAVRVFKEDVTQDREQRPQTWYVEQGIPALWEDQDQDLREDLLWGLLKLYADSETDLEAVLGPENSQLSPLDVRLSWQLSRALLSTGKVAYGRDATEKADALTISFADQLINEGSWLEATFVLLHLSQADRRAKAVQDNLCRHAALLGPENGSSFATLAHTLKVPASWIWDAQALYMRAVKRDAASEVQCLLRAGSYFEAHEVFVHKVAPSAVISRDYNELASILARFEDHKNDIAGWTLGGEVYKAFLELVDRRRQRQQVSSSTLEKLVAGLPAMREHAESANVTSMAAISEMSSTVAKVMVETSRQDQDVPRVLGLPVTEDGHLKHSLQLGLSYYEGLMAGAR